jgi:hypothetical protein
MSPLNSSMHMPIAPDAMNVGRDPVICALNLIGERLPSLGGLL